MNTQQSLSLILAVLFGGLFLCELFFRYLPARKLKALSERLMWDQTAEVAAQTQQMKRIAHALEHIAVQFPEEKMPYFERLLITLQEWQHVRVR